jgi:putative tryptophan/tyrosine transport system substrate-binding protein
VRRREFITLLGGTVAWPLVVRAQQPAMPVIGFVGTGGAAPYENYVVSLTNGLKSTGHIVGQNVSIEYRWAEGHYERLSEMAAELVARKVAVIIAAGGNAPAQAAKSATNTTPIVFISGGDPVRGGLVAHLNRPDGNVTGVTMTFSAVVAKRLELLHKLVPNAATIGVLVNPNYPEADFQRHEVEESASALGQQIHLMNAGTITDIDAAFATLTQHGVSALFVANDPFFNSRRDQFVALAARHAIPAIYDTREFAAAGGLMSYGSSAVEAFYQAGMYTGKILKGAQIGDLPVMQATKFELVINLKAAKALGLGIPPTLLALADEVIE